MLTDGRENIEGPTISFVRSTHFYWLFPNKPLEGFVLLIFYFVCPLQWLETKLESFEKFQK